MCVCVCTCECARALGVLTLSFFSSSSMLIFQNGPTPLWKTKPGGGNAMSTRGPNRRCNPRTTSTSSKAVHREGGRPRKRAGACKGEILVRNGRSAGKRGACKEILEREDISASRYHESPDERHRNMVRGRPLLCGLAPLQSERRDERGLAASCLALHNPSAAVSLSACLTPRTQPPTSSYQQGFRSALAQRSMFGRPASRSLSSFHSALSAILRR